MTTPTKPKIYAKDPIKVELKKGQWYGYCTCGYSESSPFCDSAHREHAPDMKSSKFSAVYDQTAWICQCKQTKTPPFCDGSHKELE